MNDLQALFLVVILIYLVECARWVRRGSVAFVSRLGRRFVMRHTPSALANQSGGVLLAPPLPPLGLYLPAHQWPLSLGPRGILGWVSEDLAGSRRLAQPERFMPWQEVRTVQADGKALLINGERWFKLHAQGAAARAAHDLARQARLSDKSRARALRKATRQRADAAEAEVRLAQLRRARLPLLVLCNLTFAYLFLWLPVAIGLPVAELHWAWWLLGLPPLMAAVSLTFYFTHRRMHPEDGWDRGYHLALMVLSPPAIIRAVDALAPATMEGLHPLAVARVLCSDGELRALARRGLLDLRFPAEPVCPVDAPGAAETEAWHREQLRLALEGMLHEAGIDPQELTRPPSAEGDARSYCPRCDAQYTMDEGTCADCGGLELRPFQ